MPTSAFSRTAVVVLCAVAWLVRAAADGAEASDFVDYCRSPDGQFEMQDEALQQAGASGVEIPYRVLERREISHLKGYCLSNNPAAQGRRYYHEARTYVLRISFNLSNQPLETDMICELASDGLPAAYNCDRKVVEIDTRSGGVSSAPSSQVGSSRWDHNGSVMRLDAQGKRRRFIYEAPRQGLQRVGVTAGTVLFDGERAGNGYSGTAYIFNKRCGPQAYAVSGPVSSGERRVTLYGNAPRVGSNCEVRGVRRDVLVFDLIGN